MEQKEDTSPVKRILFWAVPVVALVVSIGIFFYGFTAEKSKVVEVENALFADDSYLSQRLIAQWAKVDPYLEDCRAMGIVLRQIEEKVQYNFRLLLVVPQKDLENFILINDAGFCWVNGDNDKPSLTDIQWYKNLFELNRMPEPKLQFPLSGVGGLWDATLVKDKSLVWGIMLTQHYDQ